MEKLEKRISQLKGRSRSINLLDSPIAGANGMFNVPPSSSSPESQHGEAVVVDDLVSDFGFL